MRYTTVLFAAGTALALALPLSAWAHCDTLDGPVVSDARAALESGDVTPLLKWVRASDEADIRAAFERSRAVRELGPEARELADSSLFETLVRLHRAGEGASFTGLKPAGAVDPAVALTDQALDAGSVERLSSAIIELVSEGIRERFQRAEDASRHMDDSVAAGRAFVAAYVELTHYVEDLHRSAIGARSPHAQAHEHAQSARKGEE